MQQHARGGLSVFRWYVCGKRRHRKRTKYSKCNNSTASRWPPKGHCHKIECELQTPNVQDPTINQTTRLIISVQRAIGTRNKKKTQIMMIDDCQSQWLYVCGRPSISHKGIRNNLYGAMPDILDLFVVRTQTFTTPYQHSRMHVQQLTSAHAEYSINLWIRQVLSSFNKSSWVDCDFFLLSFYML